MSKGESRSLRRTKTMRGKTSSARVRILAQQRHPPAGLADPQSAPSHEAVRKFVEANICPFCGLGPYKVLAIHTSRSHMVDGKELRERAGLCYNAVITSPTFHAEKVAASKRQFAEGRTGIRPSVKGHKKNLSPAAIELQRQKGERGRAANPDWAHRASAQRAENLRAKLRPHHDLVAATYEAVVAEKGMAYGAVTETAKRLGWETSTTLSRINTAWSLGLGNIDRTRRGTEETRVCPVCETEFTRTRSDGWHHKTCSASCGAKLANQGRKKPLRTAQCMVCHDDFTYARRGTKPRTLCDNPACRLELSRRTASRPTSEATKRKLSVAAKRRYALLDDKENPVG